MLDQQSNAGSPLTYATPLVLPTNAPQQSSVAIVRAEGELAAIDELMADLTDSESTQSVMPINEGTSTNC